MPLEEEMEKKENEKDANIIHLSTTISFSKEFILKNRDGHETVVHGGTWLMATH